MRGDHASKATAPPPTVQEPHPLPDKYCSNGMHTHHRSRIESEPSNLDDDHNLEGWLFSEDAPPTLAFILEQTDAQLSKM
ncbi:hypothetical protein CVT26_014075 [Gymnopilus dilepis]|uniref:Uncharacterized protein n=1 Tax=Gymnopilus dilepis TaxID=231916 RepID=A0A409VXB9_9AGAR|nr:hypothetical protein CVT26_014075 [Gymnopilus dilepis]